MGNIYSRLKIMLWRVYGPRDVFYTALLFLLLPHVVMRHHPTSPADIPDHEDQISLIYVLYFIIFFELLAS